ncbi:hypothetical protein [Streptomyces flavofungini]|uniref:hypothetical protein n=1 Tax=Streptomyces flavofungini TaxID=68200 RepID=UPI0034DF905F
MGIAIAGRGQGAFVSVDVAMLTELLPDDADAGTGLAVIALFYQFPMLLAPALAVLPHEYRRSGPLPPDRR